MLRLRTYTLGRESWGPSGLRQVGFMEHPKGCAARLSVILIKPSDNSTSFLQGYALQIQARVRPLLNCRDQPIGSRGISPPAPTPSLPPLRTDYLHSPHWVFLPERSILLQNLTGATSFVTNCRIKIRDLTVPSCGAFHDYFDLGFSNLKKLIWTVSTWTTPHPTDRPRRELPSLKCPSVKSWITQ